ncbi:MAG: hypothetical protein CME62_18105 [Halobacteriovoraceae bacterium]|nr:hypothetical protein [Halobacteriovoraceae bacterium]|tara:strand:+ start:1160 stop:1672 length:513 start_codon:yes stop_codon:yes gene_type:complete
MGFFDYFMGQEQDKVKKYSELYDVLAYEFPDLNEKELILASCLAGLLARVAYVDFKLDPKEMTKILEVLKMWDISDKLDPVVAGKMAMAHIKNMAGLDNHLYVHPLKEHLSENERYKVLQSLFLVAASDGNVAIVESEEIRLITKGLELSNQHFISAQAEVVEFINALKK